MDKDEIRAKLDALGIEYDGRLSADSLAALLPQDDQEGDQPPKPKMVMARVLRDYWPTEDNQDRVRAGQTVEVTLEQLMDGMENHTMERVK